MSVGFLDFVRATFQFPDGRVSHARKHDQGQQQQPYTIKWYRCFADIPLTPEQKAKVEEEKVKQERVKEAKKKKEAKKAKAAAKVEETFL